MFGRTDLMLEIAADLPPTEGLSHHTVHEKDITLTRTTVHTETAAAAVGRPVGRYVTAELPPLGDDETHLAAHAACIARELAALLPATGSVLVAGLGNAAVTPDAIGPQAADMVLATRHIRGEWARSLGLDDLRSVAVIRTDVLGKTGMESGEILQGVCRTVRPAAVIAVDALAARSLTRLGRTVQLCDTGIAPGSGVGNARLPLSHTLLGIPVIGIGVPTVVDAATIVRELGGRDTEKNADVMMVTPREIDLVVRRAARLVALAINGALQPDYSPEELVAAAV
ncbi:MAG: GPR endopeptidase [Ruminococcaceae bacterium]|nr:GPR endopeptidase [Oscillospiraceae bacterium]